MRPRGNLRSSVSRRSWRRTRRLRKHDVAAELFPARKLCSVMERTGAADARASTGEKYDRTVSPAHCATASGQRQRRGGRGRTGGQGLTPPLLPPSGDNPLADNRTLCPYDATARTSSATSRETITSITASAREQISSLVSGTIGCGTVTTS